MLDKAIEHGKEHRKPYYHSGAFDLTCRPHGGCPWCESARAYRTAKRKPFVESFDDLIDIDITNHNFLARTEADRLYFS